ncbi:hypothetical protein DL96DRAFT_1564980 [Flagelloscypha sp. PMI_526]|nr:hypothetical protein DL96DRAFT_1564980 [Flagelloscypha sp. PMI_526]
MLKIQELHEGHPMEDPSDIGSSNLRMHRLSTIFPAEIHDRIIDSTFIHLVHPNIVSPNVTPSAHSIPSDTTALCGLVCKAWVSRSRFHVFREIVLQSNSSSVRFLALSNHPLCTFMESVEVLSMDCHWKSSDNVWLQKQLPSLPHFPRLSKLTIEETAFREYGEVTWAEFIKPRLFPHTITKLSINRCIFPSPLLFVTTIESCVNLTHLTLSRVVDNRPTDWSWADDLEAVRNDDALRHLQYLQLSPSANNVEEFPNA